MEVSIDLIKQDTLCIKYCLYFGQNKLFISLMIFWKWRGEWNRLPGECVNATSVNMFKNKIDNYFKRSGYV